MRVSRLVTVAATLALATAAPAAAVSGLGVSSALRHAARVAATPHVKARKAADHTCQAGSRKRKAVPARSAVIGDPHKQAVVACEQPPRSQLVTLQAFKQAAAAALAAFG